MRIHPNTIAAIQAQVQIEEVLGHYITLKKKGKDLWGLCPFHHEKSPSFSVAPTKGFYKCFGCDAKGDAITFLMKHQGISYVEALEHLANKYGIVIQKENPAGKDLESQREQDGLYIVLDIAQTYYHETLLQAPSARHAQNYLTKRGIPASLVKKFGLGYSPDSWRAWYDFAIAKGYDVGMLKKAGLVIQKETSVYDRFRGRLMFPIHNIGGKVIGFGARRLDQNEETPKYINSPETPVYQKSYVLYGLYQAKHAIKEKSFCYLVEGYTDVLALHRMGVGNVVACSGTSLTTSHIQLLSRFTKSVTLLFDSDTAGLKAAMRGADLLLAQGFDVKVVALPTGEDPDSYVQRHGSKAFLTHLTTHTQDFITFKTQLLLDKAQEDPKAKQEAIRAVVATLCLMADVVKRAVYIQVCSKLLGMTQKVLEEAVDQFLRKKSFSTIARSTLKQKKSVIETVQGVSPRERILLYILLHYGTHTIAEDKLLGTYLFEELEEISFVTPVYKTLLEAFKKQWHEVGSITGKDFIKAQPEEIKQAAIKVMAQPYSVGEWEKYYQIAVPNEEDGLAQWCFRSMLHLKLKLVQKLIASNRETLHQATTPEETDKILAVHEALKTTQKEIADALSIVVFPVTY